MNYMTYLLLILSIGLGFLIMILSYKFYIKPVFSYFDNMPSILHIVLFIVTFILPYVVMRYYYVNKEKQKALGDVVNNFSEDTISSLLDFLRTGNLKFNDSDKKIIKNIWSDMNADENISGGIKKRMLEMMRIKNIEI